MRVHLLITVIAVAVALLACGRIAEEGPDAGEAGTGDELVTMGRAHGADHESAELGDGAPEASPGLAGKMWSPAACSQAAQGVASTPTQEVFRQLLIGRWLLCDTISVFGTSDEVGIEFTFDGRWYKLYANDDGTTSRGVGFDKMGSWIVIDTSVMNGPGVFQLNLRIDGDRMIITIPAFATEPRKMRLRDSDYAIDTG